MVDLLTSHLGRLRGKRIAVLGLAFKPETDDVREVTRRPDRQVLSLRGADVVLHDPLVRFDAVRDEVGPGITQVHDVTAAATRADAIVITTGWDAYRKLDWTDIAQRMRSPIIFDGRQVVRRPPASQGRRCSRRADVPKGSTHHQRDRESECGHRSPHVTPREISVIFTETKLRGSFIVDAERREDERGFFARIFCQKEFTELGLETDVAQANMALSVKRGTLRGMHFSIPAGHRGEAGAVPARRSYRCDRGLAARERNLSATRGC